MKKREKRLLWYRGAKHALKEMKKMNVNIQIISYELLGISGMTYILRDDYWARGFVAMLKRKAHGKPASMTSNQKSVIGGRA